ncbi:maleylpyruvate isomerase N-terminal domain-containing protein [Aquiflexum gelatinilyticum]|uniref:maleylpyruvate isomerase N-terminal domain-containing protein n=1 Tax=Aquiflexum gelatinilyticum TaxID=2961943 RepID=UPI00216749BA|nr:maleylpyruvate isomerase N-terminal domain-containing protein [Aquiflexum gelatinilyticum]MCS4436236.1 maleylpyruvate isomerase N-terminal domain-containing protein [Aquiflexum gelatinilyticum]
MIEVKHLFHELDILLIDFLKSLEPSDWEKPTSAKLWNVKDVASHLLDTNLRTLSIQRDGYFGEKPPQIKEYMDLISWLNQLNADWVSACKRLSPDVLIGLLESSGKEVSDYYVSLPEMEEAIFSVAWAGEEKSLNWMHLAREYTEKWHHQQQIRDAVGKPSLLQARYFEPLMDTFMMALPFTFAKENAIDSTVIEVKIVGEFSKSWWLEKNQDLWKLIKQGSNPPTSIVQLEDKIAWKLFCKNLRPQDILHKIEISGDLKLGKRVLEMVSVMA